MFVPLLRIFPNQNLLPIFGSFAKAFVLISPRRENPIKARNRVKMGETQRGHTLAATRGEGAILGAKKEEIHEFFSCRGSHFFVL